MKNNILFIIPSLSFGGAEMLLLQQVKWFKNNGYNPNVAILSINNDQQLVNDLALPSTQVLIFNSSKSVLNTSSIIYAIRHSNELVRFARRNKVNNIVAHLPLGHLWGRLLKLNRHNAQ